MYLLLDASKEILGRLQAVQEGHGKATSACSIFHFIVINLQGSRYQHHVAGCQLLMIVILLEDTLVYLSDVCQQGKPPCPGQPQPCASSLKVFACKYLRLSWPPVSRLCGPAELPAVEIASPSCIDEEPALLTFQGTRPC